MHAQDEHGDASGTPSGDHVCLTVAICSYNRCGRLPQLLQALRSQTCSLPFEILIVDNNSADATADVVRRLAALPGAPIRYVLERQQGIPFARNRAVAEAVHSDFLLFMDDDELPEPGLLESAVRSLRGEGAACVGGRVKVVFPGNRRPRWLTDELLGFLAAVDYGDKPFWIRDEATPVWTANVAYRIDLFRDDPTLRFDHRYNRKGRGVGGGSDLVMFNALLRRGVPILYCPDMVVHHHVEAWRLKRRYFLQLHFVSGRKRGQYETREYSRTVAGVPLFMFSHAARHAARAAAMCVRQKPGTLRQSMNASHALGMIWGRLLRRYGDEGLAGVARSRTR
jgi:glycosyltransferase involved in cell wall biosynthesis